MESKKKTEPELLQRASLEKCTTVLDKIARAFIEHEVNLTEAMTILVNLYAWTELSSDFDKEGLDALRNSFFTSVDMQKTNPPTVTNTVEVEKEPTRTVK